jgi:hypothetical protein
MARFGGPFCYTCHIVEGRIRGAALTKRELAFGCAGIAIGALAFGCAGIAIGAAIVGATWGAQSWQSQPIPPGYSRFYDVCLADGKSRTACDAVIRLAVAYDKQVKAEKEQAKAAQTAAKDNECFEATKGDPAKNLFDCFNPHPGARIKK